MYWLFYVPLPTLPNISQSQPAISSSSIFPKASQQPQPFVQIQEGLKNFLDVTVEDLVKAGYENRKKVWSEAQDAQLVYLRDKKKLDWSEIAEKLQGRNHKMCYSRYRRLESRTKIVWTQAEDRLLCELVEKQGQNWELIIQYFEKRTMKQIRERYLNYLHPNISKQDWTLEQDYKLVVLINEYGLEWKAIGTFFPTRTQNQLKNRYFGRLKRISDKKQLASESASRNKDQPSENLE